MSAAEKLSHLTEAEKDLFREQITYLYRWCKDVKAAKTKEKKK